MPCVFKALATAVLRGLRRLEPLPWANATRALPLARALFPAARSAECGHRGFRALFLRHLVGNGLRSNRS